MANRDGGGTRRDGPAERGDEARHSIGVVENRTGVSAATLRAWEDRYDAVRPERSSGGHRLYSDGEIRRLRVLKRLTDHGHRIGRIAGRPTPELVEMLEADESSGAVPAVEADSGLEELVRDLHRAVETFDGARLDAGFRRAALEHSVPRLVDDVVAPLLRRLGRAWRAGELSPAQEHLASGVVVRTLGWVMNSFEPDEDAPAVVVGTLPGQRHSLGAMLAAASAAAVGWRVTYLGAELPGEDVARAARETGAAVAALSLVHPEADATTARELRSLRSRLPGSTRLFVGGRAVPSYDDVLDEIGAARLEHYRELRERLEALRA